MSKRIVFAALVSGILLLGAAACGGGGGDDDSGTPGTPVASPRISQDSLKFQPNEVTIVAGDLVSFSNDETALHTVNVDGQEASGDMERDDVFELTIDDPGTYAITCKYHPQMRATIYVVEAP